jgi:hypothetical protein
MLPVELAVVVDDAVDVLTVAVDTLSSSSDLVLATSASRTASTALEAKARAVKGLLFASVTLST